MSSLFEVTLEEDTFLVMEETLGPAVNVVLTDAEGTAYNSVEVNGVERPLRGIFEAPGIDSQSGIGTATHAPVVSTAPILHVQSVLLENALGRPLSTRDTFTIKGRAYKPQRPHDDGSGLISIKLLDTEK